MRKLIALLGITLGTLFLYGEMESSHATPTTEFWTPSSSDIQPFGVSHLDIDNYFTFGTKSRKGAFPTDVGYTIGVLPYDKVQLEVGADILEPLNNPFFFNAKVGTPENSLFDGSPAMNIGIFDLNTNKRITSTQGFRTDFDIVDLIVGKTLPFNLGRVHVGGYYGNAAALVDRDGRKANAGFMIAWDKGFAHTKDAAGNEYDKWVIGIDYASGKNYIGGGGVGVNYAFTKDIVLLTGPVYLNEPRLPSLLGNSEHWVWSTQMDINF